MNIARTAVLGVLVSAVPALAQVPAIPAVPAAPVVAAPLSAGTVPAAAAPVGPIAAPTRNIYSFFLPNAEQKAAHAARKVRFCKSPAGQLLNGMTKPLSLATGGLIGGCCPPELTDPTGASAENLAKDPSDPEGATGRIKKLEAEAAERRAAVKYLGTVDCIRFPEAEAALVKALRTDTNECVRYEAAVALVRGCCCTKKTIDALTLTVSASTKDGNPPETSPRVRAASAQALSKCVTKGVEASPPDATTDPPPELPPTGPATSTDKAEARRVLEAYYANAAAHPRLVTGQRSLTDAYKVAETMAVPTPMPAVAVAPATPPPAAAPTPALFPIRLTRSEEPPPAVAPPPAAMVPPPATAVPPTGKRSMWEILKGSVKVKPSPGTDK